MQSSGTEYSTSQRILAIACGALPGLFLLVTSTTFLVQGQFVYDVKRILQLCLLIALFMAATLNPGLRLAFAGQLSRIPRWLGLLLGLIITLGFVSSIVSATSLQLAVNSLLEVALLSLLVIAALIIAACRVVAGKLFDQVTITVLALAAIAVGIQELLGVTAALLNQLEYFSRISLMFFSWPRFYNQVQAWTLPALGLLPLIWSRSGSELMRSTWFQAVVCLLALTLHWYIILMTGGRGVAISLLVTFMVCLVLLPAIRRATLHWHLPGILLGALLFLAIEQTNHQVQSTRNASAVPVAGESTQSDPTIAAEQKQTTTGENQFSSQSMSGRLSLNSSGRLPLWKDSLGYIKEHPLLGIGPMNFACTGPEYRAGHPHNFALQFAAEWGLLAALGLMLIVIYLARATWHSLKKHLDNYETRLGSLLATGVFAAGVYSFLSGVLVMPASQVMGLLIGGWLLGVIPGDKVIRRVNVRNAALILISVLTISGAVTAFSFSELGKREYRETIIAPLDRAVPRYWQQGKQCKYLDKF